MDMDIPTNSWDSYRFKIGVVGEVMTLNDYTDNAS